MLINSRSVLALAAFGGLVLAGCNSSTTSSAPAGGGGTGGTGGTHTVVTVHDASGTGQVLTNAAGHTLYLSDQERSGKLMCTSSACTTFWTPLTVATGQQPSGPSAVMSKLGTVTRPDGSKQVTLNGAPLYTFSFDHAAGDAKGNGFKDSFDGVHFTWHAATVTGVAAPPPPMSSSGGGGYHY
jgi:predicted lipoprotein with Yx(FWY)xxD motif